MKGIFRFLWVVTFSCLLWGQDETIVEGELVQPSYQLVLRYYTWPLTGIIHDQLEIPALPRAYLQGTGRPRRVVLARGALCPPFRYSGTEAPELVTLIPDGKDPETGEPRFRQQVLAKPEIPEEWKEALVILFPQSKLADGTWRALPLETGEIQLPKGGSRFMNTSRRNLLLEYNGDRKQLAAGESITLSGGGGGKDRIRIRIYGKNPRNERVEMIYTASHWRKENAGNLYVIYPHNHNRLKVLQLSPEEMEQPEPEGSAKTSASR